MNLNETLNISIENIRNVVNNSILLLRDADLQLSKNGFTPIYGNTIGCEPSKNINQSSDNFGNFFPQYMSRSYKPNKNSKIKNKILFLNIQFYHTNFDTFVPCLIAGVFTIKDQLCLSIKKLTTLLTEKLTTPA